MSANPAKDSSAETNNRKSLQRFSIEVWNLTQNWITIGRKAQEEMNIFLNARLQLLYAKQSIDGEYKQEEGYAKSQLTYDEKAKLQKIIVSSIEKLTEYVEGFNKIVSKFRIALQRTIAWHTLELYLPLIIEMYAREVDLKQKALLDLGSFEHKDVFMAVGEIFLHEPHIDQNLIGVFYSLVASEEK